MRFTASDMTIDGVIEGAAPAAHPDGSHAVRRPVILMTHADGRASVLRDITLAPGLDRLVERAAASREPVTLFLRSRDPGRSGTAFGIRTAAGLNLAPPSPGRGAWGALAAYATLAPATLMAGAGPAALVWLAAALHQALGLRRPSPGAAEGHPARGAALAPAPSNARPPVTRGRGSPRD